MNHLHLRLTAICLGILSASGAYASCGSTACSINTNWDEHSASKPGLSIDLRESYSRANQLRSGSSTIVADTANNGEVENLRTINKITTLSADYTANEHWGFATNIPYVTRDHNHNLGPYTGGVSAGYESFYAQSLGDIKVVGRYRWTLNEAEHSGVGIKLGLKLNTGRRDFTLNTGVKPNEVTLQPGNGSTDLILGAFWNQATPGKTLSWFAQGSLQSSAKHDAAFRPGNQINLDAGTRYAFSSSLSGLLQLNAQWSATDSGASAALTAAGNPSSGGRSVSLTPGLIYAVAAGTNLYGLLQLPLYQYANGEQLTASKSVTVGINHRF
jgi:hypothetical protein